MYTSPVALTLGFHGCDKETGEWILEGKGRHLRKSENDYDWLGHGIYFWENNPERAYQFVQELKENPRRGKNPIKEPFVIGAIIDVGNCLNLLEAASLHLLQESYVTLCEIHEKGGVPLPKNKKDVKTGELLQRNLDCAVIEMLHDLTNSTYDTVRGVFVEGPHHFMKTPDSGRRTIFRFAYVI